jgi:hypothetical protein
VAALPDNANDESPALVVSSSSDNHVSGNLSQPGRTNAVLLVTPSVPLDFGSSGAPSLFLTSPQTSPVLANRIVVITTPLPSQSDQLSGSAGDDRVQDSVLDDNDLGQFGAASISPIKDHGAAASVLLRPALADAVWQSLAADDLGPVYSPVATPVESTLAEVAGNGMPASLFDTASASDTDTPPAALAWAAFLGGMSFLELRARSRRPGFQDHTDERARV